MTIIEKIAEEHSDIYNNVFISRHLEKKLMRKYENNVKITSMHNKKVFMPKNHTIDDGLFSLLEETNILQKAALILQKKILNIKKLIARKPEDYRFIDGRMLKKSTKNN